MFMWLRLRRALAVIQLPLVRNRVTLFIPAVPALVLTALRSCACSRTTPIDLGVRKLPLSSVLVKTTITVRKTDLRYRDFRYDIVNSFLTYFA